MLCSLAQSLIISHQNHDQKKKKKKKKLALIPPVSFAYCFQTLFFFKANDSNFV